MTKEDDAAMAQALADALATAMSLAGGSRYKLAAVVGVSHPAVMRWTRIPIEHVPKIETALGIPRSRQRPDIYPPDRERDPVGTPSNEAA